MTSRQYKKLWIKARITWICNRYGTVERDYLTCSNSLTSDLEDVLVYHGVNPNDAIRLSWKWSD